MLKAFLRLRSTVATSSQDESDKILALGIYCSVRLALKDVCLA